MPRPPSSLRLLALVCSLVACGHSLQAAERFNASFADGSRIVGEELRDWYDTKAEPKVADRKLFDPKNPARWVLDTSQAPSPPGTQFVEHVGGDRFPCRVIEYASGSENPYNRQLPHLLVEPSISIGWPDARQRRPSRVLTRWLRRVVWEARGGDRYQPGTLFHRDGRQLAYRALRWQSDSVRLLLDDGPSEVSFTQIAELHLPRQDAWDAYCEQLALISPDCTSRIMRTEGEGGLRITASMERLQARNNGSHPDHWYHGVQPAWALEPLWLRHRSIRSRTFFQPHELPLSACEPTKVDQRYVLAGGWSWQRDRNAQGGPLRVASADYGWGLGMHAQAALTFELPALVRRFTARVGLDELVRDGGCARAIVYLGDMESVPVFKSPLMIGSEQVVDIGKIELPPVEAGKTNRLTLVADAAYRDRPAGADPLDIRDVVDWLEPLVELDPDALRHEVARRMPDLIAAWNVWDVVEADAGPAQVVNAWDDTDQRNLKYQPLVRPRQKLLSLERTAEITPDAKALLLCVNRLANQASPAKLMVEADGKLLGTFEVPERRSAAEPDPIYVPLDEFIGREVALRVTQSPLGPQSLIDWRAAALVSYWPGLEPVFEDEEDAVKHIAADSVSIDNEHAYSGTASLKVLPAEGADPHRIELELPIRESPRLGEYRYLRFAWKVQGEGRVCCSIGHDGLWGPDGVGRDSRRTAQRSFRYDAGRGEPSYEAALRIEKKPPVEWVVVTRDLFNDFGDFLLTGLSFSVPEGEAAWVDHVYLGRSPQDFSRVETKPRK